MIKVDLKDLSPSCVTRAKGAQAFVVLQKRLVALDAENPILFVYSEDDIIAFSFLDELLQRGQRHVANAIFFLIPLGEISRIYEKLARISSLRNITIKYLLAEDGLPQIVKPKGLLNVSNVEFEEKPSSEN